MAARRRRHGIAGTLGESPLPWPFRRKDANVKIQSDVAVAIKAHDLKLDPARLALKYAAMRKDGFAFFRATCHLFYAHLPELGRLMQAPSAWCCGDLHLANFGSFKGDNGAVYFDLNDFDEALLAPCIWDALRASASIVVAHQSLQTTPGHGAQLVKKFIDAYGDALARGHAGWIERDTATGVVAELIGQMKGLSRKDFLDRRTHRKGNSRAITCDGDHALEATPAEQERVRALVRRWAKARAEPQPVPDGFFDVADVALRIAGLGSLGVERYVVLVQGKGAPDRMRLLDIKRARPSSSVAASQTQQPAWDNQAERVISVQLRMQAQTPAYLGTMLDGKRSYVVRELQPREDRLDLAQLGRQPAQLDVAIATFGRLLAFAQLRAAGRQGAANADGLMAYGAKVKWRDSLAQAALLCAERSGADWAEFCASFDAGAFRLGSSAPG